ncbi:M15 family metallopeptidase [Oerskovia turbata]
MGKHSQRRFAATLPGRSLRRRTPVAIAVALASVAITTTAGAANLAATPTATKVASAVISPSEGAETITSTAGATASTPEEQAALDAASSELVRAETLASEGASSLTPEQLAQVTATRDQLRVLLSATTSAADAKAEAATGETTAATAPATDTPLEASTALDTPATLDGSPTLDTGSTLDAAADSTLDGRDTFRASRAGAEGRTPLTTDETAADPAADPASVEAVPVDPDAVDPAAPAAAPAVDQAQVAPTVEEISAATQALRALLDTTAVAVSVEPGPPSAEEVAAQQAAERAAMANQLAVWANSTAGYGNGMIPTDVLCSPSFAPGHLIRCDAAYQLEQLNVAYRAAFGTDISVTSSYRSYGAQVAVKASRGYFAATPGTSNHGMAQALDLGGGVNAFGTAQYNWMLANAPAYGWNNPDWARPGGSKPEAWHWEYGVTY